jgi:hypothetical protein
MPASYQAASHEPKYSIHTEGWTEGRRRIGRIVDTREREAYTALFDHLERGWRILSPLAATAEALAYSRPGLIPSSDLHQDVAAFVHVMLTEEFRGIAFECLTLIPEPSGRVPDPRAEDPIADMAVVLRCLRIAALSAAHPAFPAPFRTMPDAARALGEWSGDFARVFRPVARRACAAHRGSRPLQILSGTP